MFLQELFHVRSQCPLFQYCLPNFFAFVIEIGQELALKAIDLGRLYIIDMAARESVEHRHFLFDGEWCVLRLFQHLDSPSTAFDHRPSLFIKVRTKLRERLQFPELSQVETERPRHLLHGLDLGC